MRNERFSFSKLQATTVLCVYRGQGRRCAFCARLHVGLQNVRLWNHGRRLQPCDPLAALFLRGACVISGVHIKPECMSTKTFSHRWHLPRTVLPSRYSVPSPLFPLSLPSPSLSFLPFYSLPSPPPPPFDHAKGQIQALKNVHVFLNILETGLGDGSVAKCLTRMHDNLSLDPQHRDGKPCVMVHVYNPSPGGSGWWQRRQAELTGRTIQTLCPKHQEDIV